MQRLNEKKVKALIIYYSLTGNTEKVAKAIGRGMEKQGLKPIIMSIQEVKDEDLYDYDMICLGSPTHGMLPAKPIFDFANEKMRENMKHGFLKPSSPLLPGKYAAVFCTCSGIHDGIGEGMPAVEWLRSFLEHLGYDVRAKWTVISEFLSDKRSTFNTEGRFGDIRGRPSSHDLAKVEGDAAALVRQLRLVLGTN